MGSKSHIQNGNFEGVPDIEMVLSAAQHRGIVYPQYHKVRPQTQYAAKGIIQSTIPTARMWPLTSGCHIQFSSMKNPLTAMQPVPELLLLHTQSHNHFTALWTLSGITRVSPYQKVHFAIFWNFWSKMKITQADAPTI